MPTTGDAVRGHLWRSHSPLYSGGQYRFCVGGVDKMARSGRLGWSDDPFGLSADSLWTAAVDSQGPSDGVGVVSDETQQEMARAEVIVAGVAIRLIPGASQYCF